MDRGEGKVKEKLLKKSQVSGKGKKASRIDSGLGGGAKKFPENA